MKKSSNGIFWYLLIVGALLSALLWMGNQAKQATQYTKNDFVNDIVEGKVASVKIKPSKDVPTGTVYVYRSDDTVSYFHVTDTAAVEELIKVVEASKPVSTDYIEVLVEAVPTERWFVNHLLPLLIVAALVILFFG